MLSKITLVLISCLERRSTPTSISSMHNSKFWNNWHFKYFSPSVVNPISASLLLRITITSLCMLAFDCSVQSLTTLHISNSLRDPSNSSSICLLLVPMIVGWLSIGVTYQCFLAILVSHWVYDLLKMMMTKKLWLQIDKCNILIIFEIRMLVFIFSFW